MSLREDVLDSSSRLSGLSSAQSCAVLLLFNTSLARLAAALGCEALLDVRVPIPPEVCPQLRSVSFVLYTGKFQYLRGSNLALLAAMVEALWIQAWMPKPEVLLLLLLLLLLKLPSIP